MPADLRYRVTGPMAVAGTAPGETLKAAPDADEHGRHAVGDELVNLVAAVAGGALVPLSKAAAEAAGVSPATDAEPDAGADG